MKTIHRETRETKVSVWLEIAPAEISSAKVATGEPFLDHMLVTLARYAGWGLRVEAEGDLPHHLAEDVAITLGLALRDATPESCTRYGNAAVPMDDAWVEAVLDAGGRFWYEGALPDRRYEHVLRSFAENAGLTLHVQVVRGVDRHHVVEAAFKAVGLALRQALRQGDAIFSTKGSVRIRREG